MRRKLYKSLVNWKNSVGRKPLVLEGARQVGKTYLLKQFGREQYTNIVYLNCHDNPMAKSIFSQDLNVRRIMQAIEALTRETIVAGQTLIFIDEIQEATHALESLKYFSENAPEQHIVVAGSLLGVVNRPGESFPVGKVNTMRLYPMSFEEYLWAMGEERIASLIDSGEWSVLQLQEPRLQELLRQYYYVGGMPEAVLSFSTQGAVNIVRDIQLEILKAYSNDIAKHAGDETQRIRLLWNSIPGQLARENKRFVYGAVRRGARARDLENAIQWLIDAGLVYKVNRCRKPTLPLKFYEDFDAFKLFLLDVGLLGALADVPASLMLITNDVFKEYKGAFTENYVLQQLLATVQLSVYYYSKDNSSQEIDFLVQNGDRILPIEVKAEVNVKSKSLRSFVNEHESTGLKGVRFSMLPRVDQGWMENVPLYGIFGYLRQ